MPESIVRAGARVAVMTVAVCVPGCGGGRSAPDPAQAAPVVGQATHGVTSPAGLASTPTLVEVPPPPFSEGIFPCSDCHTEPDLPPNRTRRPLVDAHDEIVLKHDEQHRWCLDCHDAVDRDALHLASGDLIPFAQSYTLCGQCHGEKARDWRAGVHGRRTGSWNGRKEYLLCVHCHDPHAPRFKALAPQPAPLRPSRTAPESGASRQAEGTRSSQGRQQPGLLDTSDKEPM